MAKTILFKRGTVANLPDLQEGEPGWSTDTKQLYVGDGAGTPVKVGTDVSDFMDDALAAANLAALLTALGLDTSLATLAVPDSTTISAYGKTLVDDADAATAIATLGLDADIATLSVPTSCTISSFAKTYLDDTTAAAMRTTIGAAKSMFVNIEDYGAVGDGVTDNVTALENAVDACDEGGTIYIPPGEFFITSMWTIDKRVNICGAGIASIISVNVSGGTCIKAGTSASYTENIVWRDFAILGEAASCERVVHLIKVNRSIFENVHILAGTDTPGYGVFIEWGICNHYNFIISTNITYPTTLTLAAPTTGIVAQTNAGAAEVCNANVFDCIIEGCTGEGLYIYTAGSDGNNRITGTYEGITGYSIHLKGGQGAHLYDLHSEASGDSVNEVCLESTDWAIVGPGFNSFGTATTADVILIDADDTHFVGGFATSVSIDANSANTRFVSFSYVAVADSGSGSKKTTFEALA